LTYTYRCQKCGVFERIEKLKDKPLENCPTCDGPVHRIIVPGTAIVFKGPGFYKTDYN